MTDDNQWTKNETGSGLQEKRVLLQGITIKVEAMVKLSGLVNP